MHNSCNHFDENALTPDEREAMELVADMIRDDWQREAAQYLDAVMGEY
jgi:hypothetical protein